MGRERADVEPRWVGHPVLATCIRAIVAVVPGIAGLLTGLGLAAVVPRPDGPAFFAWLGALLVSACIAVAIVERLASRLLPIATLLKLSLAFPDKVPSRYGRNCGSQIRRSHSCPWIRTTGYPSPARS